MTHSEIAVALIELLGNRGILAYKCESATGSVYVSILGSRQKIRIADHGKHYGWFRYNVRTDLKKTRVFFYAGEYVYLFVETDLSNVCYRIVKDYSNSRKRNANAFVKQRKSKRSRAGGVY